MICIGDVHGEFKKLEWMLFNMKVKGNIKGLVSLNDEIVQVGDLGVFNLKDIEHLNKFLPDNFSFFPGNHDNPELVSNVKGYMGYSGSKKVRDQTVSWLGGGLSIDKNRRIQGVSWWPEEELEYSQLKLVIDKWEDNPSQIMISHECPSLIKTHVISNLDKLMIASRTEVALQQIWDIQKPKIWIFGHHHKKIDHTIDNCRFICLEELIRGHIPNCWIQV